MTPTRPLEGIRVLDFGAFIAGPYAATLLAMMGAEVVKVEPPRGGDAFRRGLGTRDPYFAQSNAGKQSLAVDLKAPEGVALIKALLPAFDVLIENSRPGVMDRLGLGADAVRAVHPGIIYSSVSGFGDGGPWRDRAAFDTIGLSMSGFLSIMADEDRPQLAGTCIGDLTTALVSVIGIVSALVGRLRRGDVNGVQVQSSLLEAMSTITVDAMTQTFETGRNPHRESRHPSAQSFVLKCADGAALTVHMSGSQKFWESFARAIGRADLIDDPRFRTYPDRKAHYFDLRPLVEAEFLRHPRDAWMAILAQADVPHAPYVTGLELTGHPQMRWLDLYDPPRADGLRLTRAPWRFDGQRGGRGADVPEIGEHTRAWALRVLPEAEVARLLAAGILAEPERPQP